MRSNCNGKLAGDSLTTLSRSLKTNLEKLEHACTNNAFSSACSHTHTHTAAAVAGKVAGGKRKDDIYIYHLWMRSNCV